ncbi:hypothetical protein E2320_020727, partial [Naja naja]
MELEKNRKENSPCAYGSKKYSIEKIISITNYDLVILGASEEYKKTNVLIQKKGTEIWESLSTLWKTIEQLFVIS